jgi:PPK2 family polyphosphate:nucleotide phosphotransferase
MPLNPADVKRFIKQFQVKPGSKISLKKDFDPGSTGGFKKPNNAEEVLGNVIEHISNYTDRLYAEKSQSLLIIFQALDAAGKDSVVDHVMSGLNPAHTQVFSFKAPSSEELSHDYLWRSVKALPERGRLGIFNRSYYEEVLVVRVHPSFLDAQRLPANTLGEALWPQRFDEINNFEKYLVNQGTHILKIYLNVSKEEQRQRQLERINKPEKNWKFNAADIKERAYWDEYMKAYEDMFRNTTTEHAPWYIIPADHKWFTRIAAAAIIANKLTEMNPQFPTVDDDDMAKMQDALKALIAEGPVEDAGKNSGKKQKGKKKKAKG